MGSMFQRIPAMGSVFGQAPGLGEVRILGDHSFNARPSARQSPPNLNCNAAWDPSCPRPLPNQTMAPYVPSSYLMGSDRGMTLGQIEYHPPLVLRRKR